MSSPEFSESTGDQDKARGRTDGLSFLSWLLTHAPDHYEAPVALVVAHPDDEAIGAGAQLPRCRSLTIIHSTDGSPPDLTDAKRAGCASRAEYAALRRREFESAMRLVGTVRHRAVGLVDQEASFHLVHLTARIGELLDELRPAVLLTHSYEGGHPDHDATAFAVHAALRLRQRQNLLNPELVEMTSYHNQSGGMAVGAFLPVPGRDVVAIVLTDGQRRLKQCLFRAYASQASVLQFFPLDVERFRHAPTYDFLQPPHPGLLFYEQFPWGIDGPRWRDLARQA